MTGDGVALLFGGTVAGVLFSQAVDALVEHHRRTVDRRGPPYDELERLDKELGALCDELRGLERHVAGVAERVAGIEGVVSAVIERVLPKGRRD